MIYDIYTDGATSKNGQEDAYGGWAYVCTYVQNDMKHYTFTDAGFVPNATNQICELTAAIRACEFADSFIDLSFGDTINIYSDSAYLTNCYKDKWYESWMNNGWINSKKEPVANKELWEQLIPFFQNPRFTFIKVKGHSGNKYNELADELAVKAKRGV